MSASRAHTHASWHIAVLLALSAGLSAEPASAPHQPAGIAGRWKLTIEFPDEARAAGLEVVEKDGAVTGKFVASFAGGEVAIEGEWVDGTLTFQASTIGGPHPGMSLDFTATLKDNATLAGTLSAPFGDFAWTAQRIH